MIEIVRIYRRNPYRAKIEFFFANTTGHGLLEFMHNPADPPRLWLIRPLQGTTAIRFDVTMSDADSQQLTHLELTAKPETLAFLADPSGLTVAHHEDGPSLFPVLRICA